MLCDPVKQYLAEIENRLKNLLLTIDVSEDGFIRNILRIRVARHCIIEIVEAAADGATIILREFFNEKNFQSYADIFQRLAKLGVISIKTRDSMIALTRLMNLIIHRYWNIDDIKIYHDAHGSGIESIRRFYS